MTNKSERDAFYKQVEEKYGFTPKRIADILQRAGYTTFNIDNEKEYIVLITDLRKQIKDLRVKHGLVEDKHYDLCPLCPGLKEMGGDGWPWICSKGGATHMIVWKAGLMKVRAMDPELKDEEAATKALEYAKEILKINGQKTKEEQTA